METVSLSTVRVQCEASCAALSGARLVVGGADGAVRLLTWAAHGWAPSAERRAAHRYGCTAACFSPAGLLVATAGGDGAVRVWTGNDLIARRKLIAPQASGVQALAWACGERLAAAHQDGALRVWRIRAGALEAELRVHDDALRGLTMLAGGALLLTAAADGVLKVFNFDEVCRAGVGSESRPAPVLWEDGAHELGVLCAAAVGDLAATGGHDGRVRLWRVTGEAGSLGVAAGATLRGHAGPVTALSASRRALASGSLDRSARLWALPAGACLRVLPAHARYLTCIALHTDMYFLITGSNDKTIKTWAIGDFTLDTPLEMPCDLESHFALGDLEGIAELEEPIDEGARNADSLSFREGGEEEEGCARVWSERVHSGAVNCITVSGQSLASCSSDGSVAVFACSAEGLRRRAVARPGSYPALAVHLHADGRLLLCAGLDGRALVLDTETGTEVASVHVGVGEEGCGGGGGVRDARFAPTPPLRALLATDDGLAATWPLEGDCGELIIEARGLADSITCCAWAGRARAAALGAATGHLRLVAGARDLCSQPDAHDLGVLSCDFATELCFEQDSKSSYILATGGRDAFLKIWRVTLTDDEGLSGGLELCQQVGAHEGGVQCVRWGARGRLASGGADRWARVWALHLGGERARVSLLVTVAAGGTGCAGGAPAVALPAPGLLAVGTLDGTLELWRIPESKQSREEGAECCARCWAPGDVTRWLHDYVTRWPGSPVSGAEEAWLAARVRAAGLRGATLLDASFDDVLTIFGLGDKSNADREANEPQPSEAGACEISDSTRRRLIDELRWLRRPCDDDEPAECPHRLLCPLTHTALRDAVRAPDGYSYERTALAEHRLAHPDPLISPMTKRRMHSLKLSPNYRLRDQIRARCGWRETSRADAH